MDGLISSLILRLRELFRQEPDVFRGQRRGSLVDSGVNDNPPVLRLRAHHICCMRYWRVSFNERGPDFRRVESKIKEMLLSEPESRIMVIEGVDELCQVCPQCVDGSCRSPQGDETEVRKWDAILLRELDLPIGTCLTSAEWQSLIRQKTPFKLCQKCRWHKVCSVSG